MAVSVFAPALAGAAAKSTGASAPFSPSPATPPWPQENDPSFWDQIRDQFYIPRGEAFVNRWGVYAIVIGRFFGPLRAAVPLVAGIFAMAYWPFQIANFASAFLWAAVLLKLGDFGAQVTTWLWHHFSNWW